MSKLIGTNPNQVPSNGDLGTAAFMDKKEFLLSKGSSLSAIDAVVPKSAVDVFVYDTNKDSDGGAWRKRTQHTSWYNERLNTTTRGTRKEFPAVAVIVAESDTVTIYDADDSSMPMWMVFTAGEIASAGPMFTFWGVGTSGIVSSISALNGIISIGVNNGSSGGIFVGVCGADFLSDDGFMLRFYGSQNIKYTRPISQRNASDYTNTSIVTSNGLVGGNVNDLAMTVLPNAPIDSATGLPVPTIVVATGGGTSIIKNDGTVVDINDALTDREVTNVIIRGNDVTHWNVPNGTVQQFFDALSLTSDNTSDCKYNYSYGGGGGSTENITAMLLETLDSNRHLANGKTYKDIHIANSDGVSKIHDGYDREFSTNTFSIFDSSVAYMTSAYNTGWMHGDIKLATLSDTDDTDAVFTELAANSSFNTSSDWTLGSGWSISGGQALKTTNDNNSISQLVSGLDTSRTYVFEVDVATGSSSIYFYFNGSYSIAISGTGKQSVTFKPNSTSINIGVTGITGNGTVLNSISFSLAEEDRSLNGNGLRVFGTVTKTPVATGADLVAYSGFGNGNYLHQPYNSDLDFGTGTFSITTWAKIPGVNSYSPTLVDRHVLNQARILLYAEYGNQQPRIYIAHTNGSTSTYVTGPTPIDDGKWHCWHANRRGNGELELWIDGVKVAYGGIGVDSISVSTNGPTIIGNDYTGGGTGYMNGDMALTRISATAPSAEQIKKIYEDEKVLFQENAKATLYGSSDAVTALAYDDSTELLHVGTSAGRSVFQGLRRIDNTTDAVGAAISASNGMVAED